jgi:hypothetical protein
VSTTIESGSATPTAYESWTIDPSDLGSVCSKMSTDRQSGACKLYLCHTKSIEMHGLYCQLGNCALR